MGVKKSLTKFWNFDQTLHSQNFSDPALESYWDIRIGVTINETIIAEINIWNC